MGSLVGSLGTTGAQQVGQAAAQGGMTGANTAAAMAGSAGLQGAANAGLANAAGAGAAGAAGYAPNAIDFAGGQGFPSVGDFSQAMGRISGAAPAGNVFLSGLQNFLGTMGREEIPGGMGQGPLAGGLPQDAGLPGYGGGGLMGGLTSHIGGSVGTQGQIGEIVGMLARRALSMGPHGGQALGLLDGTANFANGIQGLQYQPGAPPAENAHSGAGTFGRAIHPNGTNQASKSIGRLGQIVQLAISAYCLQEDVPIAMWDGSTKSVAAIKPKDRVLSRGIDGDYRVGLVVARNVIPVPDDHEMTLLPGGCWVTLGHPMADGKTAGELSSIRRKGGVFRTFDILVDSPTGEYYAGGLWYRSTMDPRHQAVKEAANG